jgi:hypothetical protein
MHSLSDSIHTIKAKNVPKGFPGVERRLAIKGLESCITPAQSLSTIEQLNGDRLLFTEVIKKVACPLFPNAESVLRTDHLGNGLYFYAKRSARLTVPSGLEYPSYLIGGVVMKKFFICVIAASLLGVFIMVGLFSRTVAYSDLSKTKIAYVVRDEGSSFIYVMNPDGSNRIKLTAGSMPCWSPCGTKIAFTVEKDGNRDIYYMDVDGSDITRLTTHSDGDVNPAWSPDGSMIAFNSSRSGSSQIWRTNVSDGDGEANWGYNLTQVTKDTPHK